MGLDRFIRDLDVGAFKPLDGALRLSLMGCPSGTQLAVDTVVSPYMATARHDGSARRHENFELVLLVNGSVCVTKDCEMSSPWN